jgi:electron transfer flavoprotein alpha subunit
MSQDIYVVIEHLRGQVADISYVILAAAHALTQGTGGNVVAVLLGHDAQGLADGLNADGVLYIDHKSLADFTSDAYQQALASLIDKNSPRAVLLGHTSVGTDVAGGLSVRLELPLVSQCRTVRAENGTLKFVSQICGGKIMAEGDLPDETVLVTMMPGGFKPEQGQSTQPPEMARAEIPELEELRISLTQYVEPPAGDVDISREPILIAAGRGIQRQNNLELVEELAEAMSGVVCASRPVVDQGWLPTTRMVGKSGKTVKPTIYLALGISGAPEHAEGMVSSETIIAINTDPAAPIFDVVKHGAAIDLLDLLPALTEKVQQAKGG